MTVSRALDAKFAKVDIAASADLIAAVPGNSIVVVSYYLVNTAVAQTLKFQSGGSTDLTGVMTNAQSVFAFPGPGPAFQTAKGEKLNIVLSGTSQVSGHIAYYLDD